MSPFALFVARVGIAEAARRLGVTPRTIRRWALDGVSTRYQEKAAKAVARHLGSIAAAGTKRKKKQEAFGLAPPLEPYRDLSGRGVDKLTPEQVLPTRSPSGRELRRALRSEEGRPEVSHEEPIGTPYSVGTMKWFTIGKSVLDVDVDELYRLAIDTWETTRPTRNYISVKLLFFRYIPFNPIYKGEMIRKQGTWGEFWVSSQAASSKRRFRDYLEYHIENIVRRAQSRIFFLEMIGVRMIDRRHEE